MFPSDAGDVVAVLCGFAGAVVAAVFAGSTGTAGSVAFLWLAGGLLAGATVGSRVGRLLD